MIHQPQLPGFGHEGELAPESELVDVHEQAPDVDRELVVVGTAGGVSVSETVASPEQRDPRAFPLDESGLIITDEVVPGMFDHDWGPVLGNGKGKIEFDITVAPGRMSLGRRKLAAARRYAQLVNNRSVRARGNEDTTAANAAVDDWLKVSLEQGWRRPSS